MLRWYFEYTGLNFNPTYRNFNVANRKIQII